VNASRKMLIMNNITMACMCKIDIVARYIMKLEKLINQLGVVGDEVKYDELDQIA
jgi:hypothetical protein